MADPTCFFCSVCRDLLLKLPWWGKQPNTRSPSAACVIGAEAQHYNKQAFSTPPWFLDDWLNGFHDLRAAHPPPRGGAESLVRASCGDAVRVSRPSSPHAPGPARQCGGGADDRREGLATSDYRFVYLGPAGSHTALHADVLRSFSWCGSPCCDRLEMQGAPRMRGPFRAAW